MPAPSTDEPALQDPADLREVDAAKRPSKKPCHATVLTCTSSIASSPNVWADLLECLLHQIMVLLSSSSDILAFAATCSSWRTALVSFPSTLSFNVPPLCLQSHIRYPETRVLPVREKRNIRYSHRGQIRINHSLVHNCEWQLTDPVNGSSSQHCSPPHNLPNRMHYLGCSYGNIIVSDSYQCLLVDVFGFTTMRPPKLKTTGKHEIYYGILDGPLKSPNSHLFLFSRSSIFQWQVGSDAWLEHPLILGIFQILFFNGEMFARDHLDGLHTIRLAPHLSIHEVDLDWTEYWREDIVVRRNVMYWRVVCGDMFLMVDLSMSTDRGATVFFRVFRLHFSIVPPRWVKVENLGNHAIFVSFDQRNPAFCCTCPERWGGKNNCIYVATQSKKNDKPWTVVKLGQAVSRNWRPVVYPNAYPYGIPGQPDNIWVFPSFVHDVGL